MKISERKLQAVEEVIAFLLIVLFVYTSISKILDFQNFRTELGQSPLLSAYAFLVAPGVLVIELLLALFLAIRATRTWAMLFSFSLMAMFTAYILIILNFSDFVPCSCGGVVQQLGWREHIIFNSAFILLSALGFYIRMRETGGTNLKTTTHAS